MKTLATMRIDMSKLKMQMNQLTKEEHLKEVKSAIGALKIVQAMTFQCPEKMISKVSKWIIVYFVKFNCTIPMKHSLWHALFLKDLLSKYLFPL